MKWKKIGLIIKNKTKGITILFKSNKIVSLAAVKDSCIENNKEDKVVGIQQEFKLGQELAHISVDNNIYNNYIYTNPFRREQGESPPAESG